MDKNIFLAFNSLDYSYYKKKKLLVVNDHLHKLENLVKRNKKISIQFDKANLSRRKKYLDKLRNKIFLKIYKDLNKINKVNKSKKYWKVITIPWLFQFLDQTYNKFQTINKLVKNKKKFKIYKFSKDRVILPTSYESLHEIYNSDEWDYQINFEIIEFFFKNKFQIIEKKNDLISKRIRALKDKYNKIYFFKKKFLKTFDNQKVTFFKGHFGKLDEFKLNLSLNQIPNNYKILSKKLNFKINDKIRKNKKLKKINNGIYEKFICENIYKHLPVFLLEQYEHYNNNCDISLPKKPKVIFNINSLWWVTLLMFYTAKKISLKKTKLIGYQHGCNYNLYNSFFFDHEVNLCDIFLTWGWVISKKTKKLGINRTFKKEIMGEDILIINRSAHKYFLNDPSNYNNMEWSNYLKVLLNLPNHFNLDLKKKLVYRMHPGNTWNERDFLKKKLKKVRFDKNNLKSSINKSRIVICTFLDTTFLKCISSNIPVVTYFDFNRANISKKNYLLLKSLKKQKILFEDYKELCCHVNDNYQNIKQWWNSEKVQYSVKKFSNVHAFNEEYKIKKIINHIKSEL